MRAIVLSANGTRLENFGSASTLLTARTQGDLRDILREVERAVECRRLTAIGFVAYEAAPAFDPALRVNQTSTPLAQFGLFEGAPVEVALPAVIPCELHWTPSISPSVYQRSFEAIKKHIAAGDTYQVNLTFPLTAQYQGDPIQLFTRLCAAQPNAAYRCFIETEEIALCSVSPELFFRLDGSSITARPMKGTAPRGCTPEEDVKLSRALHDSSKNRAENLMIVDMMRNDLGRIAQTGTVKVDSLFAIERYDTVWQMTSTVSARTHASLADIFAALFPCSSITGAPKAKTMEIIASLEPFPRGVYTGAIGVIRPHRQAHFSVAIRTATVDKKTKIATYGVGGGIVWDSQWDQEYAEALCKSKVLTSAHTEFDLVETIRWSPDGGYTLLAYHLERLKKSSFYWGFPYDESNMRKSLEDFEKTLSPDRQHRVRMQLSRDGAIRIESTPFEPVGSAPVKLAFCAFPINRADRLLYHKTTCRERYVQACSSRPGYDDVVLWNKEGEVTETCIANLIFRIGGQLVTPSVSCGLLPGTMREKLLRQGVIVESIVTIPAALKATEVFRINSVRGQQCGTIDPATVPDAFRGAE